MNAAYRYWDRVGWYPDFYACLDDQLIISHHHEIERLYKSRLIRKLFLHRDFFKYQPHRIGNPDFVIFDQTSRHWFPRNAKPLGLPPLFDRPAFRISDSSKITTGSHAVRFAADLGFRTILLMGIDLRYVEILPEAEPTQGVGLKIGKTPKQNPNYFFDSYQQAGDRYNIPNPAAHNGDLHPRAFELVAKDFEANSVACKIYNTNPKSILSDRNVFPLLPIDKALGASRLGAVFIPCNSREVSDIIDNFSLWATAELSPSVAPEMGGRPSLVFVFNNVSAQVYQAKIKAAFIETGMSRFFYGPVFEYLQLEGKTDLYERDYTKTVGEEGFKSGPNNQFFRSMECMAKYGHYSFLMEVDCLPLRRGWLEDLQRVVDGAEDFWLMGSAYRGSEMLSKTNTRHINGNGIYATGDPEFQAFIADFWEPQTWRMIRDVDKRLAYDCILETLFSKDALRDPERLALWKSVAHRFQYTEWIQNISAASDLKATDASLVTRLRAAFPKTAMLHNRVAQKVMVDQLKAGALTGRRQVPADESQHTSPRLLILDMTAMGNSSATGALKSTLLNDWPADRLLQIAKQGPHGLASVHQDSAGTYNLKPLDLAGAKACIAEFAPDLILYRPVPDTEALHSLALQEITQRKLPLVTWIMDDWPARMEAEAPDAWRKMKPDLEYLLQNSVLRLSISEAMSEAFVRRYGVPFVPFANAVDPAEWPATEKRSSKDGIFRIRFAGGLAPDMNRSSILQIAEAVERIGQSGVKISFQINTQQWWRDQTEELFKKFRHTQIQTANLKPREYRDWISQADSVIIAYNFDEASQRYVRYSMANKMPECLASGALLFAYGPRGVATIDYLETTQAAIVVSDDSIDTLEGSLRKIIADPAMIANCSRSARNLAFGQHNLLTERQRFTSLVRNIALNDANKHNDREVSTSQATPLDYSNNERLLLRVTAEFLLNPLVIQQKLDNDQAFRKMVDAAISDKTVDPALSRHVSACQKFAQSRGKS